MHSILLLTALLCALPFALGSPVNPFNKAQSDVGRKLEQYLEGRPAKVPFSDLFEPKPKIYYNGNEMEFSDFHHHTLEMRYKPRTEKEEDPELWPDDNEMINPPNSYTHFWQWKHNVDGQTKYGTGKAKMLSGRLIFDTVALVDTQAYKK
ncbi:uncharacterized protein MELLADRAFT_123562 [Melampsora larici-populina 98AG31]|uniref:Secreted protein n=1 Tax=Melampsora larici-populina (strain 98AG31 / pathotype 3-4-7) TaxID=747676 RepID=F4RB53_MELLP|nr:uncharacterized protein MELLADRAFT_123562 [Melampsora larici-populina 98AG31]EGG10100.1 secreted protein [Melampsora larici-populina 98AG31]